MVRGAITHAQRFGSNSTMQLQNARKVWHNEVGQHHLEVINLRGWFAVHCYNQITNIYQPQPMHRQITVLYHMYRTKV